MPLCLKEQETRNHLFACPATKKELIDIWSKVEEKLLNLKENEEDLEGKEKEKYLIDKIGRRTQNNPQEFLKLTAGLIKRDYIIELKSLTNWSENRCKRVLTELFNELREQLYTNI